MFRSESATYLPKLTILSRHRVRFQSEDVRAIGTLHCQMKYGVRVISADDLPQKEKDRMKEKEAANERCLNYTVSIASTLNQIKKNKIKEISLLIY